MDHANKNTNTNAGTTTYNNWSYYQPYYYYPHQPTGWICPKCNKVHAPWVASCACNQPVITWQTNTGNIVTNAMDGIKITTQYQSEYDKEENSGPKA